MAKAKRKTKFVQIGNVAVDTASIVIMDPCLLPFEQSSDEWHAERFPDGNDGDCAQDAKGHFVVICPTGMGDGYYPVYAEVDTNGNVRSVHVVFSDLMDAIDDAIEKKQE